MLTSAGLVPEIKEEFISLLPKKPAKIKLAFVTTAAYGKSFNPLWLEKDLQILITEIPPVFDWWLEDQ